MANLTKIVENSNYWEYHEGHNKKRVIKSLKRMEEISPQYKEYWAVKCFVLDQMAKNTIELFSRGKYEEGIYCKHIYDRLFTEISNIEESAGIDITNRSI